MHRAEEVTGDANDLKRLTRRVMNKAIARRLIPKQEAVTLLGNLDLAKCTETIENVSMSNSVKFRLDDQDHKSDTTLDKHRKRADSLESVSLYEYFHILCNRGDKTKRNAKIPHFIGINGRPKYPVTVDCAKHTLIVHRPWRKYPSSADWIGEFNEFINSENCPVSAQMTYARVHCRHLAKMDNYDPVAEVCDHTKNLLDLSDKELIELLGVHNEDGTNFDDSLLSQLDKGLAFRWDKPTKVSALTPNICWRETTKLTARHFFCTMKIATTPQPSSKRIAHFLKPETNGPPKIGSGNQ